MTIDETNISIMKHLREGRKPYSEIAKSLSITENTVRARVKKLEDEGIFTISGLVNPSQIPGQIVAFVGVKLKTMNLVKKGGEISKLKGVVSVAVVTGRYDLFMILMLNKDFGLLEFYTTEMSTVSEVQSVETFVAFDSFNLNLPYVLQ